MNCKENCKKYQQAIEDQQEYKITIEGTPFQYTSSNTLQILNRTSISTEEHIQIQKRGETLTINSSTIAYMYIECKIVTLINFSGNNFVLTHSLNHYEELLNDNFFRINRQCIVNKNNIKKITSSNGKISVRLKIPKDKIVSITNSKEREFYKWIKKTPNFNEITEGIE
ncbi:LytTR family DNA-binding domain-containing protein [Labilibaculum sp. K2S]|uniref:LytTR family DNA-binding domain-containing protein n=1 Tax=Labilibaculum sp. K2S TaxID=3056386 RepID=UPI0025A42277|nr:LytTR family DNA-binding domain-containing protein [Labilibaculum sp. K2S]MDM8160513.1 LytTR family DNA-binding domain-containing protein [Labilibaculum sp. K2S]